MPHNIQAIANSFITVNKLSELLRKVRFSYKAMKLFHDVTIFSCRFAFLSFFFKHEILSRLYIIVAFLCNEKIHDLPVPQAR